jgi:perosamine synthetase
MIKYPLAKPYINKSDQDAVNQVLKSSHLSRGPVVAEFERHFCRLVNSQYACAVSSGTAGLIMALQALGVKRGDEVITVSFTVPATVNSIVAIGAVPIMVDIDASTLGMDPKRLLEAVTTRSKAIIVVHAFGQSAQLNKILEIAAKFKLKVIEDACEAIGNCYKGQALGSMADIGVFAFYPNKQITTGEGGMLVTNNKSLQDSFALLRNHGRSMNGELFDQYSFGWNFRMSDINAALGLSQLKRLDQILAQRKLWADQYSDLLSHSPLIHCPQFGVDEQDSAWFVYVVRLLTVDKEAQRLKIIKQLADAGIQTGRYFAPVHLQPYYQAKFPQLKLTNTEHIAQQTLALPFYHHLQDTDIQFIAARLLECLK